MTNDFDRIGEALAFLENHRREQPSLDEIAASVGLSPHHFQRRFRRWVGISPKRFLQYLTLESAKASLGRSRSVLDATLDVGLSSPGRLHDLFVTLDAVSPGEFKAQGGELTIHTGEHEGPFGRTLLAVTERGVCGLSFHTTDCGEGYERLRKHWPRANFCDDPERTAPLFERIFSSDAKRPRLDLFVSGTNFQIKVWEALLQIEPGWLSSYGDVARAIGKPRAVRAVGTAVGANPIAWLIPCHRVIREMGAFGKYRWGPERKLAMIGWEAARAE
jgi:AraC family transcriptional regulator, regulatory protein of adaptative response / methylated-DNA-[protein]-cysteine methyltransferase